jgi:hypothetical protein
VFLVPGSDGSMCITLYVYRYVCVCMHVSQDVRWEKKRMKGDGDRGKNVFLVPGSDGSALSVSPVHVFV